MNIAAYCFSDSQHYNFVLITDNSQSLSADWSSVRGFLSNLVQAIAEAKQLSMIALSTYNSQSEQFNLDPPIFNIHWPVYIVNEFLNVDASDASTAGIVTALASTRTYLKDSIESRLNDITTDGQVVVLFSHGAIENADLDEAKEILRWLMDSGVYIVAVSKSKMNLRI